MEFNRLISNMEPSKSVTLLAKTKELQKTDPEILNLTGGEPDFPTPKAICDTVVAELAAGHTHYSDSRGDADLRARIARKLQEENHAPYQAENILITPGAKYAVVPDHSCPDQSWGMKRSGSHRAGILSVHRRSQ